MLSPLLEEIQGRGFFHQANDLDALSTSLFENKVQKAYIGFDATAPSLQIGNLVQVMKLRLLQKHGITPIVLLGGGTTLIGDPTGKDASRKMLSEEDVKTNVNKFLSLIGRFINLDKAIVLDNKEWLKDLNYLSFLRDFGTHFSVNYMMSLDSVKLRLSRAQHMSFLEFNYMIFQAYDFWYLFKNHECLLQMGGSDQWANMICGAELIRRIEGKRAFVLTSPLLTTASGQKMGKTEKGAIWLDETMTSPYDYWQFWRSCADADVIRLLKIFTDLSLDEIREYESLDGKELNRAKIRLADAATQLCHGGAVLEEIHQKVSSFFAKEDQHNSPDSPVDIVAVEYPIALDALLVFLKATESKTQAKRLIEGGGVFVDHIAQKDVKTFINKPDKPVKISVGKKKHFWIA